MRSTLRLVWAFSEACPLDDLVSVSQLSFGEWESLQTEILQLFLRPGDTVLDVGAHIGSHAIAFAGVVHPGGAVHAFEPQAGVRAMDNCWETSVKSIHMNRYKTACCVPLH